MNKEELFVMGLFKFDLVDQKEFSSRFQLKNHNDKLFYFSSFISLPLTIDITHDSGVYSSARLSVVDVFTKKAIYREWFRSRNDLIYNLIDKRQLFLHLSLAYHVKRVLGKYSIVPGNSLILTSNPRLSDKKNFDIKVLCRKYEESRWGGVGKDNYYYL